MGFFFHHLRGETKKVIIRLPLGSFRRFQLKSMNYSGGEVVFKASDIKLISKLLDLESEEIMVIFFDELVSKKTREGC